MTLGPEWFTPLRHGTGGVASSDVSRRAEERRTKWICVDINSIVLFQRYVSMFQEEPTYQFGHRREDQVSARDDRQEILK